jgi:hypothetical protein
MEIKTFSFDGMDTGAYLEWLRQALAVFHIDPPDDRYKEVDFGRTRDVARNIRKGHTPPPREQIHNEIRRTEGLLRVEYETVGKAL